MGSHTKERNQSRAELPARSPLQGHYPYREVQRSGGVRGAQPAAPSCSCHWGWPRVPWDAGRSCEHPGPPAALPAARARPMLRQLDWLRWPNLSFLGCICSGSGLCHRGPSFQPPCAEAQPQGRGCCDPGTENRGAGEGWDRSGLGTAGAGGPMAGAAVALGTVPFSIAEIRLCHQLCVGTIPPQRGHSGSQWPGCLHPAPFCFSFFPRRFAGSGFLLFFLQHVIYGNLLPR